MKKRLLQSQNRLKKQTHIQYPQEQFIIHPCHSYSFSPEMKGRYFVHLSILALFWTLSLAHRCGKNGPEISFPFRLKGSQPQDYCGYTGFDLFCTERGETAMELPFPVKDSLNGTQLPFQVKFLIEDIDYKSHLILISRVDGCLLQLLPILNLSASPFSLEYPTDDYSLEYPTDDYSFFSCSSYRTSEGIQYRSITCLSKPGHFVYAVRSSYGLDGVTQLELISCTKNFNISVPYGIMDNDGFMMSWTGPSSRLKNNSTAEDAYCNGKTQSRGAV